VLSLPHSLSTLTVCCLSLTPCQPSLCAVSPSLPVNPHCVLYLLPIGFPVDLAYVEDANIAHLLSTEAQYFMDTMVVKDTNTSLQLFNRNQKSLALDQVIAFKERGR
jgi:hypothetical protein